MPSPILGDAGQPAERDEDSDAREKRYLCVREDVRRNDLVGPQCLPRIDEGGKNLARLLAFACRRNVSYVIACLRRGR